MEKIKNTENKFMKTFIVLKSGEEITTINAISKRIASDLFKSDNKISDKDIKCFEFLEKCTINIKDDKDFDELWASWI